LSDSPTVAQSEGKEDQYKGTLVSWDEVFEFDEE
jgi:hypothetical protein